MMGLANALKNAGLAAFDGKCGDIFLVEDGDVVIPERKAQDRHLHPYGRTCVILSNNVFCQDPLYPIVTIAPTSHRVDIKDASDFPLQPSAINGLRAESLVLLGHIQPVRKASLFRKLGALTATEWEDMTVHLIWAFDRVIQRAAGTQTGDTSA
jgi:mRNA-degrading endonuclease toxin of MazEF toxin-antitoxin module